MENERRTAVPSTSRLAPEDIATRAFSSSFRGLSESEVRSFLKRVAEEMTAAQVRERELRESLTAAELRAEHREPLDESELLEALGEETAKLLRSAREAAKDIRTKAEESAARVRAEANEEADRVRSEAAGLLETRRDEADREIADLRARIDAELTEQRSEADTAIARRHEESIAEAEATRTQAAEDAERVVAEAKSMGRSMVEEAKSLRERILADLAHRRSLLQAQITELKTGREHLLDAYRTVKRTFLEATEALSLAEARFAQDRPVPVDEAEVAAAFDAAVVDDTADELGADLTDDGDVVVVIGALDVAAGGADGTEGADADGDSGSAGLVVSAGIDAATEVVADPVPDAPDAPEVSATSDGSEEKPAVGDLFARIRAQAVEVEPGPEPEAEVAVEAEPEVSAAGPDASATDATDVALPEVEAPEVEAPDVADGSVLIAPLVGGLVKRAKRVSQDEQNEVLDAIRRQKGRASAVAVLPSAEAQADAWATALHDAVVNAFTLGAGDGRAMPDELSAELAVQVTQGLRSRLVDAIDTGDADGISDRVNARFREWKSQDLEDLLTDALHAAYVTGLFVALPAGTALQWVMSSTCCADCADNSLESVLKGAEFPTGHVLPPAHPGCRCSLAATVVVQS